MAKKDLIVFVFYMGFKVWVFIIVFDYIWLDFSEKLDLVRF